MLVYGFSIVYYFIGICMNVILLVLYFFVCCFILQFKLNFWCLFCVGGFVVIVCVVVIVVGGGVIVVDRVFGVVWYEDGLMQ